MSTNVLYNFIDRFFRLIQNPPSAPASSFSSFTKHAHSLPFLSHHALGRNDLPKRVSPQTESVYILFRISDKASYSREKKESFFILSLLADQIELPEC